MLETSVSTDSESHSDKVLWRGTSQGRSCRVLGNPSGLRISQRQSVMTRRIALRAEPRSGQPESIANLTATKCYDTAHRTAGRATFPVNPIDGASEARFGRSFHRSACL